MSNTSSWILLPLIFFACNKDEGNCIRSSGDAKTMAVNFDASVHSLSVDDDFEVSIVQDSLYYAEVIYGENLIDRVRIEAEGETLSITNDNICNFTRPAADAAQVVLHMGEVHYIRSKNAGTITADQLKFDELHVETIDASGTIDLNLSGDRLELYQHSGITDIYLTGAIRECTLYASSAIPMQAEQLACDVLIAQNQGEGDMYVNARNVIYYQIFDDGNIFLSGGGNPVQWADDGRGKLFLQ